MGKMYFPDEVLNPQGEFKLVWIENNVYHGGIKGMKIHVDFTVVNCLNKSGSIAAYFYFRNGTAIPDINGRFCTTDNKVATHESFFCNCSYKRFSDFIIFMPYTELHVMNGIMLDFQLLIWAGDDILARSEMYHFYYK